MKTNITAEFLQEYFGLTDAQMEDYGFPKGG